MLELYVPGESLLHRLGAGWKLCVLFLAGSVLFYVDRLEVTLSCLLVSLALYFLAGFSLRQAWYQLRAAAWVFALIIATQALFSDWSAGVGAVLRLAAVLLLAGLLTLTTRTSEIIQGVETALSPLARFGVKTSNISLAISLTLRFIPVMLRIVEDVREAQKTRGLERSVIALALPVLIRTMKMSDDISDAIDARMF